MLTPEQIAHREYLKSATWKDIRQQILNRDKNICKHCRNIGHDVHHKTYKNWGNEKLEDLITLCRACHEQLHRIDKGIRKSKSIGTKAIWNYLNKSQKETLCKNFDISELSLFNKIDTNPNNEICNAAIKLLGYNSWYSQTTLKPLIIRENKSDKQLEQEYNKKIKEQHRIRNKKLKLKKKKNRI